MNGYINNIEKETLENEDYRRVLYTSHYSQLVVMCLGPQEEVGEEVHGLDQFIRLEQGEGKAVLDGEEQDIADNYAVVIPAGVKHNIINTSTTAKLKLYSIYSPPEHRRGTIHHTQADQQAEHFNGLVGR